VLRKVALRLLKWSDGGTRQVAYPILTLLVNATMNGKALAVWKVYAEGHGRGQAPLSGVGILGVGTAARPVRANGKSVVGGGGQGFPVCERVGLARETPVPTCLSLSPKYLSLRGQVPPLRPNA
jgi:hypothetical protein